MYANFAALKGWSFETLDISHGNTNGGYRVSRTLPVGCVHQLCTWRVALHVCAIAGSDRNRGRERCLPPELTFTSSFGADQASALPCPGVFGTLKYETGGHRVQRVPVTEVPLTPLGFILNSDSPSMCTCFTPAVIRSPVARSTRVQ